MRCRRSSCGPWRRRSVRVVAELGEDPGAEDHAESGLAGVQLSVRVTAKMLGHHLAEGVDLQR